MSRLLFAISLLLIFSISSSSQQTNPVQQFTKTDYLKKSKHQKTAAWILMGAGGALVSSAFVIGMGQATDILVGVLTLSEPEQHSNTADVLFYTGLASMAGSIPFFIASSKNKKKANQIAVLLKMEKLTSFRYQSFKQNTYPALSVRIFL